MYKGNQYHSEIYCLVRQMIFLQLSMQRLHTQASSPFQKTNAYFRILLHVHVSKVSSFLSIPRLNATQCLLLKTVLVGLKMKGKLTFCFCK